MSFYADLHIHSKYSRATSRDCDLENLAYWGRKKGITVIGTGDFTHPAWIKEIKEKLTPAEPGLFRLKPEIEKMVSSKLPAACQGAARFMLSVEVSTIYKKGDKVRKIHHLIYAPTIEKAEAINRSLEKIGNIRSDGRPILGLDSRHLLEIVLQAGSDCYLVPAHIWTPWFAVLGSKSGFDCVADCYADLADHVFAVETGLSSDPEMNWKISHLDRYRLMSNSDAHSPAKLGREVNVFHTDLDYFAMRRALETGKDYGGTLEFFPEEGKYHMDGHRKCAVRFSPEESKAHHGLCPVCQKPLTLGVMYRVEELADRKHAQKPADGGDFKSIIPLPEIISEIDGAGVASKAVTQDYENMVSRLGPELEILNTLPLDRIQKSSSSLFSEAISRMREGKVIRDAGYDGEYGTIKLFDPKEILHRGSAGVLFDMQASKKAPEIKTAKKIKSTPSPKAKKKRPAENGASLDADQERAVKTINGPLFIIAGPGSGKTRTLTHRVAHLIKEGHAKPEECLTITFTRRAAAEMRERLEKLLPEDWKRVPLFTFHSLGLKILQENREAAGLPRNFRVAGEIERAALLSQALELSEAKAAKLLREISAAKRASSKQPAPDIEKGLKILEAARDEKGWIDYDDLITEPIKLLEEDPGLKASYRGRFRFVSIDEYQDIDESQYRLIQLLVPPDGNCCAIGDPDQAIYAFRGAKVEFFMHFEKDFPAAKKILLTRNYRSGESIITASNQMIAPSALLEERRIEALLDDTGKIVIHRASSAQSEAEFVVKTIEDMLGGTSFFSIDTNRTDGSAREYSFSDFAVFYRTEAQAEFLQEALKRSGIPFDRRAHRRLSDNPEVRAFLEFAAQNKIKEDPLKTLHRARKELGGEEKNEVYERLEALALECGEKWEKFLSEIHLGEDIDLWDPRAEKVTLLTLHASKGLEFAVVFITGCEEGLLPLCWNPGTGSQNLSPLELAEERRLFYVGMTRAKDRLFLSMAKKRMRQGKIREQEDSRFLKDIEEKLLEKSVSAFKKKSKTPQFDLFPS